MQAERELAGAVVHKRGGKQARPRSEAPRKVAAIQDEWDKWSRQRGVHMAPGLAFTSAEHLPKRLRRVGEPE